MTSPNPKLSEILKQFQDKFDERITTLEISYQNHGGNPWIGETVPDFISKVYSLAKEEGINDL